MNETNQIVTTDDGEVTVEYVNKVHRVRGVPVGQIALGVMLGNLLSALVVGAVTFALWLMLASFIAARMVDGMAATQ